MCWELCGKEEKLMKREDEGKEGRKKEKEGKNGPSC
jgi:hypothetical protein